MKLLAEHTLSLKTVNPLNAHELPFARSSRAQSERMAARMGALIALPPRHWPRGTFAKVNRFVLELTRIHSPRARPLDDHDGLPASLKHVVDGICDHLGVDDGDRSRIRITYAPQETGDWGVRFKVFEDGPPPG